MIARRDAAAVAFDAAQDAYQALCSGAAWRTLEAARVERRGAQDAVDAQG